MLTLGQYLSPKKNTLPIHRYYTPEALDRLRLDDERLGFKQVQSGPLVRSSYYAERLSADTPRPYKHSKTPKATQELNPLECLENTGRIKASR